MEYWTNELERVLTWGVSFELRAELALQLITHFGCVAGKIDGEDTAGRAKLMLQEPNELVDRCFAIAERFVEVAEAKNSIRVPTVSLEQKAQQMGYLRKVAMNAEFDRTTKTNE